MSHDQSRQDFQSFYRRNDSINKDRYSAHDLRFRRLLKRLKTNLNVLTKEYQLPSFLRKSRQRRAAVGVLLLFLAAVFIHPWNIDETALTELSQELEVFFEVAFLVTTIIGLFILFGLLYILISWLCGEGGGTVVLPFKDLTKDSQYSGKAISDSLVAELHRIRHIHQSFLHKDKYTDKYECIKFPSLAPNPENLNESIQEVGTIGWGDNQISIGKFLMTLRQLWPFGSSGKVITGSVQQYGNKIRIVARIEHHEVSAWEATREIENPDTILELIRELAYKVAKQLESKVSTQDWSAFRFFTEAISNFIKYQRTDSLDNLKKAYEHCQNAISADKKYEKVHYLLYRIGIAAYKREDFALAKDAFQDALKLKQEDARLYNGLANVYLALDNSEEAEYNYKVADHLDGSLPRPVDGLGILESRRGNYEGAAGFYWQAISRDPDFWPAYHNLADDCRRLGKYQEAEKYFKYAKEIQPNEIPIHIGLGWTYFVQEKLKQAEDEFKKALYLDGKNCLVYANLGILHFMQGEEDEGSKWLKKAIAVCPMQYVDKLANNVYKVAIGQVSAGIDGLKSLVDETPKDVEHEIQEVINDANYLSKNKSIAENMQEAIKILDRCVEKSRSSNFSQANS